MASIFDVLDQLAETAITDKSHCSMEATVKENEIEIYIRTDDLDTVREKAVSRERQEQYGLYVEKTPGRTSGGSMRIRETIAYQQSDAEPEVSYEFTLKIRDSETGVQDEMNLPADHDAMQRFKLVADSSLVKMRYNVPAGLAKYEGAVFEVDVFEHTQTEPWVKVDLELPEDGHVDESTLMEALGVVFPTFTDSVIVYPSDKRDNTASAQLAKSIMDKHGSLKGPFKP